MNDLRGLAINGFTNSKDVFDSTDFEKDPLLPLIRQTIKKYLRKSNRNNKKYHNFSLRAELERYTSEFIHDGTFIYAMHIEGFQIHRVENHCHFNISNKSAEHFFKANYTVQNLQRWISDMQPKNYLRLKPLYGSYKYHINEAIHERLYIHKKKDIQFANEIIAKELDYSIETINYWFHLRKIDQESIPSYDLERIANLLNTDPDELMNAPVTA